MGQYTSKVNMFVGTAGDHGQLYPAAEMPFGFVALGPDTFPGAARGTAHSGYDFNDSRILGFSHTRFSGTGNRGVGGNVLALPTVGVPETDLEACAAGFDKNTERCVPGRYSVTLADGIGVALTATNWVGLHRYTYPPDADAWVLLDFGRGFTPVRDAHCTVLSASELTAEITCTQMHDVGWYRLFVCVRFSRPAEHIEVEPKSRLSAAIGASGAGGALRALARFGKTGGQPLMMKVGLSCISVGQARRNLEAESSDWDLERVAAACDAAWEAVLGRLEVHGVPEHETLVYTHMYNSCLSPMNCTEAGGRFMGDDGEVHQADGYVHYNGWSIWDSYRTKFPLLTLLAPERMPDMMHALTVTLSQRLGTVPPDQFFGFAGFLPLPTVRLELANTILLDAYAKGLMPRDAEAARQVMVNLARLEFPPAWAALGYVPERPDETCQRAYDNWAAARYCDLLGHDEDARFLDRRGAFYRNVWDPERRFFRARDRHGDWLPWPEDLTAVDETYVYEGSAWHWRWAPVHAVRDLVEMMGGRERFIAELEDFFECDLHNHGNEPGVHAPWLFAAAGAPWLSQTWVRKVLTEPMTQRYGTHGFLPEPYRGRIYRNEPAGMIPEMDDDDGCMAAWYVLSAIGLFPVCVGRPLYALGMPLFETVAIRGPEDDHQFQIRVQNWDPANWYIEAATLDGLTHDHAWIRHQAIARGGTLHLNAGKTPNRNWGTDDVPW